MKGRHLLAASWHVAAIAVAIIYLCSLSEGQKRPRGRSHSPFNSFTNRRQNLRSSSFHHRLRSQGVNQFEHRNPTPRTQTPQTPKPQTPIRVSRHRLPQRIRGRRFHFGLGGERRGASFLIGPFASEKTQCRRATNCDRRAKFRTMDGTCNNWANPIWGSSGHTFVRLLEAEYGKNGGIRTTYRATDGKTKPLPSARNVSNILLKVSTSSDLSRKFSHMLPLWGQFLDHDITKTPTAEPVECCKGPGEEEPEECISIKVPPNDPEWGNSRICMELHKSERCGSGYESEQFNVLTAYIDGSAVYGSTNEEAKKLREFKHGKLKISADNMLPHEDDSKKTCLIPLDDSDKKCFQAGDSRVNVWNLLIALHTLFMREHNRLAEKFADWYKKKGFDDDIIDKLAYEEARRIVAAEMQVITYNEFLKHLLGKDLMRYYHLNIGEAKFGRHYSYNPRVDATLHNSFSAAALRVGHTLIAGHSQPKHDDYTDAGDPLTLVEMFNQPSSYRSVGQDYTMRAAISEPCNHADGKFADGMKNHLFERTFGVGHGLDLLAVNTQRGRDHGLPSYKKFRQSCRLKPVGSFPEMGKQYHTKEMAEHLKEAYGDVEAIDLFMGGVTEKPVRGGLVGETFGCILGRQFQKLRFGDRFWFENTRSEYPFNYPQIQQLKKVKLSHIICDNTNISKVPVEAMELQHHSQYTYCEDLKDKMDIDLWMKRGFVPYYKHRNQLPYDLLSHGN